MNTAAPATPEHLRERMVDTIAATHHLTPAVEEAMRTVPRHEFVPDATAEDAYKDIAVTIKDNPAGGLPLSCASVPSLVADMLVQLDVHPGDRIIEIGAGTGYNAALLARLTGPTGHVATVDIDEDVTAHARHTLAATGNKDVVVITGDGGLGAPAHGPAARMIVTVGAWDIPPAWWDQLATGGRLVVPLRWRGTTYSIAFVRHGDRMVSDTMELCGFVPMIGQDGEHTATIDPDGLISLYWDADQPIDPTALAGVLDQPSTQTGSGVLIRGDESFDGVWLRLAATDPATCRIAADQAAIDSGLIKLVIPTRTPALAEGTSLAYLTITRTETEDPARWELGATGYGPVGPQLADRLTDAIRAWSKDRKARPITTIHPAGTPDDRVDGYVIDKPGTRVTFAY
ncbi:methyltransferase, FxLD system [Kitasatospora viridis]|uniref:Protein-L-isoaspartate O-methyltransferase n=1 Tax=Kitasatospora viridis TaxID=281105 RepID=A0A561UGU0_9ACTN|nr:methyltransferase, FxLD system [Kitasatospora viridis]TWF98589.1 protein-L-isoaspartate(D-aspartate) O-methyltransferase [Kitasatospora viridis]